MGTDINGVIEYRRASACAGHGPGSWAQAIDLDILNDTRNYDAFACLFGVRNFANFRPIAADRGLPDDATDFTVAHMARWGCFGATWIGWSEVEAVDWDELADLPDSRIHEYRRQPDGSLAFRGKAGHNTRFAKVSGTPIGAQGEGKIWPEGTEWIDGDAVFRSERLSRSQAVTLEWAPVWAVMRALAGVHGDDNVRLIVWFDD
ncbi:hypothetical protein [Amycolatopsis alba]|uniref:Uncharacterized protein n=1 Tax=Amycolatopsis alba DSM 44262 TaxID=1125972 RepID=A0A229RFC8_AMYAL|nr:hypothetical protein [Amycolatopsis alba]OXM45360.1 hypothetical protein CFP75_30865 [Amycolatopsis alba DSM 44262]